MPRTDLSQQRDNLMRSSRRGGQIPRRLVLAAMLCLYAACGPAETPEALPQAPLPSDEELCSQLDKVLGETFERKLSLDEHAAWQILHGALAFRRDFQVERDGEMVSAVDHLLEGGQIKGWTVRAGERGLQAILESGTKTGQGHADQWLAVLAQCNLEPTQVIRVGTRDFTMSDYVAQVQWDAPRNVQREFSWTLIGLTTYLPTTASWTAMDGNAWSIDRLMEIELDQELATSACGGSHRLIGMTMALNRHLSQDGELTGVWQQADEVIQEAIRSAHRLQNPDGSFSTHYFARPGNSPDLAQNLGATGHVLEFLTLAMTDEQLREPWVQRAVWNLCDLFQQTRDLPLECGALYHAAHGLVLYRSRIFGERKRGET